MKKTLCLYFQVHQPLKLRQYHFFDIGKNNDYYDDFANGNSIRKMAQRSYLPANEMLLELIKKYGKEFKVSFSISGLAIEQFINYAPEVVDSFKRLADTGNVEFLSETYSYSLACLADKVEFRNQVEAHSKIVEETFGVKPVTFSNTEQIYSDEIGEMVAEMGYTTMVTEGARHVLGWKSPDYLYTNSIDTNLKVLLNNFRLSDDISLRFSNKEWDQWPMTADKYATWLEASEGEIVNIFMDYDIIGNYHGAETGIFDFFASLPEQIFKSTNFEFLTPKEAVVKHQSIASIHVPYPISWSNEESDLTAWLGNELQNSAFEELYKISPKMVDIKDEALLQDYRNLQASDNFYYMNTKLFAGGIIGNHSSPYDTPYEAFINYMNVLSDFILRVEESLNGEKENLNKE